MEEATTNAVAPEPTKDQLLNQVASVLLDWRTIRYGSVLTNRDDTLLQRGGGRGLKIYDDLERDAHAYAVLNKRKQAVIDLPVTVAHSTDSPTPLDEEAATLLREVLKGMQYDRICTEQLDANLKGYAVGEIMWRVSKTWIEVDDVICRDQTRFVFDTSNRIKLLTQEAMVDGVLMPDKKFLVYRHGSKDGSPYGLGIGSKLFWPVYFKRKDIAFWLIFLDKFGSPTPVGKYKNGTAPADQNKLLAAVRAFSSETGIIIPEGMIIELLEAKRSGDQGAYERMARYMDEQISEAVLGETLSTNTTGSGSGSRALGEVHERVSERLAQSDADLLSDSHNRTLVRWIVEYGMPGAQVNLPLIQRKPDKAEDLGKRAERDKKLHEMGADFTPEYISTTYGEGVVWPTPEQRAARARLSQPRLQIAGGKDQDKVANFLEGLLTDAVASDDADQQGIVDASEALAGQWRELIGDRVEDIQSIIDGSGDLVTARERLAALMDQPPPAKALSKLAATRFAAALLGRKSKQ
ncbi:DUF935 domain-containing protein [Hydrocarboniphaga effusa]|uniref:DUF935 domain-containing protein n=1 Tax=Hydrocarboniphaga effusa TaxID=243629 RepID=UPI003BAA3325